MTGTPRGGTMHLIIPGRLSRRPRAGVGETKGILRFPGAWALMAVKDADPRNNSPSISALTEATRGLLLGVFSA